MPLRDEPSRYVAERREEAGDISPIEDSASVVEEASADGSDESKKRPMSRSGPRQGHWNWMG